MTLQTSSDLGKILSEEMLLEYAVPSTLVEMANTLYIDDDTPVMVDKMEMPHRATCPVNFDLFREKYVPMMDESARKLKEKKLLLCLVMARDIVFPLLKLITVQMFGQ